MPVTTMGIPFDPPGLFQNDFLFMEKDLKRTLSIRILHYLFHKIS